MSLLKPMRKGVIGIITLIVLVACQDRNQVKANEAIQTTDSVANTLDVGNSSAANFLSFDKRKSERDVLDYLKSKRIHYYYSSNVCSLWHSGFESLENCKGSCGRFIVANNLRLEEMNFPFAIFSIYNEKLTQIDLVATPDCNKGDIWDLRNLYEEKYGPPDYFKDQLNECSETWTWNNKKDTIVIRFESSPPFDLTIEERHALSKDWANPKNRFDRFWIGFPERSKFYECFKAERKRIDDSMARHPQNTQKRVSDQI